MKNRPVVYFIQEQCRQGLWRAAGSGYAFLRIEFTLSIDDFPGTQ
jgi:hypothetical protein